MQESVVLFCGNEACGKIQGLPAETDYFDLLGVPQGKERFLSLDMTAVDRSMKDLQKRLHPDLYRTKSAQEQDYSTANSALVNRAYQCLRSDSNRAAYILEHYHGVDVVSEKSGSFQDHELNMHVFFLARGDG